jgi:hypothetical protein
MSTISTQITHSIVLTGSGAYASPLTITASGGLIDIPGPAAIYGENGFGGYTIVNYGKVTSPNFGIDFENGSVSNFGYLGGDEGIVIEGSHYPGVVNNYGTISGSEEAVFMEHGGAVTNHGEISSSNGFGIFLTYGGNVDNTGVVLGTYLGRIAAAVYARYMPGTVVNSGTIGGLAGIRLEAGGTVVDSGRISGAATAIFLGGTGSNLLELETGYNLSGGIVGSGSAANTLGLSSALGAVTAGYNGLGLSGFGFVDFAAPTGDNDETLVIADTASLPGTIEGFTAFHDILDLTNFTYHPGASATETGNVLTIVSGSDTLTVNLAGNYPSIHWQAVQDAGTGTEVEPACFARGTRILTESGDRPVEELSIGDLVVTGSGAIRPIKWIGRRSYKGAFLFRNSDIWPIRVNAGALGPDMPRRDLYLSGRHALFLDGLLVPVECLVNGSSILRCRCPDEIEYFHIELASHDVILAEGAPAETFVDCDDRGIFHNAHEFAELYRGEEPPRWRFCAPRVEAGRDLDRVRARLLKRIDLGDAASCRGRARR